MKPGQEFWNLYNHDLVRVAVAVPEVRVADPRFNAEATVVLLERAAAARAVLAVFPELGLSAYSCDDLFHQRALLDGAEDALRRVLEASETLDLVPKTPKPHEIDLSGNNKRNFKRKNKFKAHFLTI